MEVSGHSIAPSAVENFLDLCRARVELRSVRRVAQRREALDTARPLAHRQRQLGRLHTNVVALALARARAEVVAGEIGRILGGADRPEARR